MEVVPFFGKTSTVLELAHGAGRAVSFSLQELSFLQSE
jgi:hypothetical protein